MHILVSSLRNTNVVSWSMPGRNEQNKRELKKASANCYQLDAFFQGIRKTVNESKNSFSEYRNRSTPISPDLLNSSQDIPFKSKENNSPCSEHILNEEFQSWQLILSRQQTSLSNFDFNVDLEPGSPPSPAAPTPLWGVIFFCKVPLDYKLSDSSSKRKCLAKKI